MINQQTKPRTFSESLNFIEQGFLRMTLDEQFDFLEYFKPIVKGTKGKFRKSVMKQLAQYLEKQMMKNLNSWLKSEIKG
jgi:hypothetical protein